MGLASSIGGSKPSEETRVDLKGAGGLEEGGKPYLFIWFQARAFSFPMKKLGFKTIVFYR